MTAKVVVNSLTQGDGDEKDQRRQFDLDVKSEPNKYPNRYDWRPKMSKVVKELRTGKFLKVEGITERGRLRCREIQFSRTGRMMKKQKRFLHQADVVAVYPAEIKNLLDNMLSCGIISKV